MDEDEWFAKVDELLESKGVGLDSANDGWMFMFENGTAPEDAIFEMLN